MTGDHSHVLTVGVSIGPLMLRVALLAAVSAVAGFALLRAFIGEPGRRTATAVAGLAAGAVALELMLSGGLDLPEQLVVLILALLGVVLYLIRSTNPRRDTAMRLVVPWIVGVVGVFALIEFARAWFGGGEPAAVAVLLHTGAVLALTGLAAFVACRPRTRPATAAVRGMAVVLGLALVAGAAQAIVLRPPYPPEPGVATIHQTAVGSSTVDVLVVPNRPGWNLVHAPSPGVSVGTDRNRLVALEPRAGAAGTWAPLWLAPGRNTLWVDAAGSMGQLSTDAGAGPAAPPGLAGPDGPECASALLARALANSPPPDRCPADELTPDDARALRDTISLLAAQGIRSITLIIDGTPRAAAAARAIRSAVAAAGLTVADPARPDGPAVVVSGWSTAASAAPGSYLAPWLALDGNALGGDLWRRYRDALAAGFPGQSPSATGFQAWVRAQQPAG